MEDFYPMLVNIEVNHLDSSVEWYQIAQGFRVVYRGPGLIHLRRERYQDLLLYPNQSAELINRGEGIVVHFQAGDTRLDGITLKAIRAGTLDVEGPVDQPWNVHQVTVFDPDGYRLRFSEVIDPILNFHQVTGAQPEW
jgi:catechol 2,3-dioxygenase-like lactoylglutathione lyase family enzyme